MHGNGQWWDKGATVCVQFASLAQKRLFFMLFQGSSGSAENLIAFFLFGKLQLDEPTFVSVSGLCVSACV